MTPTSRTGSFVQKTLEKNARLLQGGDVQGFMASFDDKPLEDCLAELSEFVELDELVVTRGLISHKGSKAPKKEKDVWSYPPPHWIQHLTAQAQALGLTDHGLGLLFVRNRFEQQTGVGENRGGEYHTRIDGEVLLYAAREPARSIVFTAKGDTYIDVASAGYVRGNYINIKPVMYVNGESFWHDFELSEYMHDYDFDMYHCTNPGEEGLPTAEARVEALQELVSSTFPGVAFAPELTEKLLAQLALFFSPDRRPWGIGP